MPNLDYGMDLENVFERKLNKGQFVAPTISPELSAFGEKIGAPKPEPTGLEKFMTGFTAAGPLLAQIGTSLMRGRNTVTGAPVETEGSLIGGALTSALSSMKLNAAMKKMIASQLSGGGAEGSSFNEGQPVGLTSADVVGLSPEQISGLYSAGLGLREKELERPFKNMQALSDSYLKIMSGEAKPAEIALHNATAQKTLEEIAAMPAKNWQEWQAKDAATKKITAEIEEVKAKTETEKGKPAVAEEEKKKTKAETKKLETEVDVNFIAFKKRLETEYGPLHEMRLGDKVVLTNAATGKQVGSFAVGATPESGIKVKEEARKDITFAAGQIAPWIVPIIESNLATTKDQKQMQILGQLLALMKPIGGGEIDVKAIKVLASRIPGLAEKFDRAIDTYMTSGGNEQFKGQMVRSIFSEGMVSKSAEKPGEKKSILEKNKPAAAAAPPVTQFTTQLTGKPAGVYESDSWRIKWDGKIVTSIEPKKPTSSIKELHNFGTF